ncbi:MAG: hypothetical protein GX811_09475 [Lentisphaerae bacterium]|nr:hypothetical protein [Lentisphaerota bacterium]
MKEIKCKGDHQGHLCILASKGQFEEISKISANPKFICFNCGRVADCEKYLCNPMPIKSDK